MHEMHQKRFFDSIKVLIVQSQIFGLVTFDYSKKRFQQSKVRCLYAFLLLYTHISLNLFALYRIVSIVEGPPIIYRATDLLLLILNGAYSGTLWLCGIFHGKKFILLLLKIIDFDVKLYTVCINYSKSQKKNYVEIFIRFFLLVVIIGSCISYTISHTQNHDVVADVADYVLVVLNSVSCHLIIDVVKMIKVRATLLNGEIQQLIEHLRKNNKTQQTQKFTNFLPLNEICALHHANTKIIKHFNGTFGLILLQMFGFGFVVTVVSFFYCAAELQKSQVQPLALLWAFAACTIFVIDMVKTCHACYHTIEEVKHQIVPNLNKFKNFR